MSQAAMSKHLVDVENDGDWVHLVSLLILSKTALLATWRLMIWMPKLGLEVRIWIWLLMQGLAVHLKKRVIKSCQKSFQAEYKNYWSIEEPKCWPAWEPISYVELIEHVQYKHASVDSLRYVPTIFLCGTVVQFIMRLFLVLLGLWFLMK